MTENEVWRQELENLTLQVRQVSTEDSSGYHWSVVSRAHGCHISHASGNSTTQENAQEMCVIGAQQYLEREILSLRKMLLILRPLTDQTWAMTPELDRELVIGRLYAMAETFNQRAEEGFKRGLDQAAPKELEAVRTCLAAVHKLGRVPVQPLFYLGWKQWEEQDAALRELVIEILFDQCQGWILSNSNASIKALTNRARRTEEVQQAFLAAIKELGYGEA